MISFIRLGGELEHVYEDDSALPVSQALLAIVPGQAVRVGGFALSV